jgi:hypothetical protein
MLGAVASAVDPPHLALGTLGRERVEHRQHWRRSHAGTDQDDRTLAVLERERAPRGGDLDDVPDSKRRVEVAAGGPVRLALDADAIAAGDGEA